MDHIFDLGLVHRFSHKYAASFNIGYESKGLKSSVYQVNGDYPPPAIQHSTMKIDLDYITVALISKWCPFDKLGLNVGVGPYFGYLIRGRTEFKIFVDDVLVTQGAAKISQGDFNNYDVGLMSTIGYD